MKVGLEKVDMHKGVLVKALLDSGATGMFADRAFVEKHSFKKEKLERPIKIRNVDGTSNSRELVEEKIKVNMYFKGHVKRIRMNVCD